MISLLRYLHGLAARYNGLPRYEGFDYNTSMGIYTVRKGEAIYRCEPGACACSTSFTASLLNDEPNGYQ